jgi:H+/Cl- antiporter ClcA
MPGFLLLLPLAFVLGGLYWITAGARGQTPRQRRHDRWTLALTAVLTLAAAVLAARYAPDARGPIWPEVNSALWGFFTLLAALAAGWGLRPRR